MSDNNKNVNNNNNNEKKTAEARRGLLKVMIEKFSSTPLQENEYTIADELQLKHQLATGGDTKTSLVEHDAALTTSERDYLSSLLQSGDMNSIESASLVLRDENVFPNQEQLLVDSSSSTSSSSDDDDDDVTEGILDNDSSSVNDDDDDNNGKDEKKTSIEQEVDKTPKKKNKKKKSSGNSKNDKNDIIYNIVDGANNNYNNNNRKEQHRIRNSIIQQELFRLHETEDVQPSELLQRINYAHQNSILATDDSTTSCSILSFEQQRSPSISQNNRKNSSTTMSLKTNEEEEILLSSCDNNNNNITVTGGDVNNVNNVVEINNNSAKQQPKRISSEDTTGTKDNITQATTKSDEELEEEHHQQQQRAAAALLHDSWNPFEDVSSWLDGSQGVEVSKHGGVHETTSRDSNGGAIGRPTLPPHDEEMMHRHHQHSNRSTPAPFRILGTSADDVSCHPHVLSPPLMESLLAFVPEYAAGTTIKANQHDHHQSSLASNVVTTTECLCQQDTTTEPEAAASARAAAVASPLPTSPYNFWLKYSLVRDGPGMWTFLRKVRASTLCFLAIETDEGNVFGAFTSQPWRLAKGWYGSKDTFLWKMRRSRLENTTSGTTSIVQQIYQESEIQVFPYRSGHAAVQYCSNKCLMLGQGEIIPSPTRHNPNKPPKKFDKNNKMNNKHYGYALYLDKNLTSGTTSSSETFGNPCLIDNNKRGCKFNVNNIEVWTLTHYDTVQDAEQSELSTLFLDGGRDNNHRLNFINILVGGPI